MTGNFLTRTGTRLLVGLVLTLGLGATGYAQPGMHAVASAHPLATRAGLEILADGGNAFDAAVAVSAALAVVEPYSSGIGGGGFWLLHRAADGKSVMVDGREKAPLAAHKDLYLGPDGQVVPKLSIDGPLAAGIPGAPAALEHLSRKYGRLPLSRSLAPAIRFAREGFEVEDKYRRLAEWRLPALRASPAAAAIFLVDNEVPPNGHLLRQPDLARTLEAMAASGAAGFYRGPVAARLIDGTRAAGGIWSQADFETYQIVERNPVSFVYRDMRVTSVAPPSSGGIALATIMHILEGFDLAGATGVDRKHLVVEAMRRAYRDRAEHLGDSDFHPVPMDLLTSRAYAAGLRAGIRLDRATPSATLPGAAVRDGGNDTTHFSIIDAEGNRVSATLSINYPFGAAFVPPGTGVLLNDEMDDFSAKPGVPNAYGLVGAAANAIAPGKRMLSSMSPTFLETDTRLAVVGTPGGSRIITMVLLAALAFQEGADAAEMVALPRYHHQFLPDRIQFEPGAINPGEQAILENRGHVLQQRERTYGNMHVVIWNRDDNSLDAASDPRGIGTASVIRETTLLGANQ